MSRKVEHRYRRQTGRAPGTFSSHKGKKAVKLTGSGAGCMIAIAAFVALVFGALMLL